MKKNSGDKDAVALLKEDHKEVKALFDEFEELQEEEKQDEIDEIIENACTALKIHATVEEEIFYPAAKEELDEEEDLMAEAKEEHNVVKHLIEELEEGDLDDVTKNAKFMVLAENVRHHIKEEESEMFPKAQKSDMDLSELGRQMAERKQELQQEMGVEEKVAN